MKPTLKHCSIHWRTGIVVYCSIVTVRTDLDVDHEMDGSKRGARYCYSLQQVAESESGPSYIRRTETKPRRRAGEASGKPRPPRKRKADEAEEMRRDH